MKAIYEKVDSDVEKTAQQVVDAAYKLYSALGPKLFESAYEGFLSVVANRELCGEAIQVYG